MEVDIFGIRVYCEASPSSQIEGEGVRESHWMIAADIHIVTSFRLAQQSENYLILCTYAEEDVAAGVEDPIGSCETQHVQCHPRS